MMRLSRDARPNKVGSVSYRLVAALAAWKALGCPAKYGEAIREPSAKPGGWPSRTSDLRISNVPESSRYL